MCEPVSIAAGALALGSAIYKGVSEKQAGDAAMDAAERNQRMADQAASGALQRGEFDAARIQMKGEQVMGAQVAGFAANGVDVSAGGTVAQVVAGTAGMTALDKETARNNAQREAWGLHVQGIRYLEEGERSQATGNNAFLGDIIGGAASAAGAIGAGLAATGYFDRRRDGRDPSSYGGDLW